MTSKEELLAQLSEVPSEFQDFVAKCVKDAWEAALEAAANEAESGFYADEHGATPMSPVKIATRIRNLK